ncbi:MAG: ABC transporter ATP-binding protein [Clostridia bacterium]|nr:ABC transporter ATP-binding protein [Clostridia bacterium]
MKKKETNATVYEGRNVFLRLFGYLARVKGRALLALLLVITSNGFALVGPYLSGKAIDAIGFDSATKTANVDFRQVFTFCALMALFYVLSAGLSYALNVTMIKLTQSITRRIRGEAYNKLLELPVGYFDKLQAGDVISRLSYDMDTINASFAGNILQIVTSTIAVFGSFFCMLAISPGMLGVFLLTVPLSVTYTLYKSKKVRPLFRRRSADLGELSGFTEEMLSGAKTIRAYGREKAFSERYGKRNTEASESFCTADQRAGGTLGPSVNFINNVSLSMIGSVGAVMLVLGIMTPGNIASFILYSKRFTGPINEFSNILADLQSLRSAAERVFGMMDEAPETPDAPDAKPLGQVKGEVVFEHVHFGYEEGKEILHGLDLKVEAGSTVAIVGPTGGGKTTIVNLLMRFYDPTSGRILLDGVPIDSLPRRDLRRAFTMVLQETWLMGGTVAENIAYGRQGATREDVERAARAAGIHDFILTLPRGYDTRMEDGGLNVSKGQKQLLTIARSMLSDASMLILDEATSNVDTRTEQKIEKAMLRLMEGKTCFVIAHRLSTVQNADCILVVRDGDVVEKGTHEELMKKEGFYASLYQSQFS